jgi:hypothetical protein
VEKTHAAVAKGNRAVEGYPITLRSIGETRHQRASAAQLAAGIPTTKESSGTRFLCRHIKAKKRRVRGPEIAQY